MSLTPSKLSALPNLPEGVHAAPLIEAPLPLPDWSAVAVPTPSSKPQAPTRPTRGGGVTDALASEVAGPTLPAASSAVTR